MNIANMRKLRDQLARLPDEKFDMGPVINHRSCGTVACIAGWASLLNGGPDDECQAEAFAGKWLDLDVWAANKLFMGYWSRKPHRSDITRIEAIGELDRLIAAGA